MSTPLRTSYPVPVEDLIPAARSLTAELGEIPSQNRLMKHLRVGKDKAKAVHAALTSEHASTRPESHLHSVPATVETATETEPTETAPEPASQEFVQVKAPVVPVPLVRSGWGKWVPRLPWRGGISPAAETTPETEPEPESDVRPVRSWPVLLLALPAFVAVWSGWVGLGELTGFGVVHPLPGIADGFTINSAITLPIGVETYAAFALRVWLSGRVPAKARTFAKVSALASLALGALGQVAYHLLEAQGVTSAPWPITTAVACLPVAVLGMGAALAHLITTREGSNR
ncbi:ABC transporter permease [Kribbella sp. ALI-6-A]|uniref:ABC transporter permease n=1 Tax=Kribbella sp. ALI-6-A TaxID=1933817 RepID=UPI00097C71AA|nr:ABC transporter permease [Kribbella sp. ALI-6-A]ONI67447.1 ABC transporter permease [Kribbella sp. ALI-6-A]